MGKYWIDRRLSRLVQDHRTLAVNRTDRHAPLQSPINQQRPCLRLAVGPQRGRMSSAKIPTIVSGSRREFGQLWWWAGGPQQ